MNALAPWKRTFHTLMPAMAFQRGHPFLVLGTMGGEGQPQTLTALTTRIIDFAMTVQEAIDAPRWLYGRTWALPERALYLEGRFPPKGFRGLQEQGYRVRRFPAWDERVGHAPAILIDPATGVRQGGAHASRANGRSVRCVRLAGM